MGMRASAGEHFECAAGDHQGGRSHQNPDFMRVKESMQRLEHAGHERRAGSKARDRRRGHSQGRQATTQRVKADQGGVGDMRLLAGPGAVML